MKSINLKSSLAHYLAKSIEDNDVVVSNLIEKNGFALVRMIVDKNGNVSLDAVHHVFDFFSENSKESIGGVFKVVRWFPFSDS